MSGTNSGADIFGNPGTSNVITLSVGSLGTSTTFAGTIENNWNNDTTSTVALSKVGGGMLTLSGVNYYTGGTTVSGGTLQIGDGIANNGAVAGNITNNSTLAFANPTQYNYTGLISGSGNLVKSGTGMLWFNNSTAQSYNGATTIQAGTLRGQLSYARDLWFHERLPGRRPGHVRVQFQHQFPFRFRNGQPILQQCDCAHGRRHERVRRRHQQRRRWR